MMRIVMAGKACSRTAVICLLLMTWAPTATSAQGPAIQWQQRVEVASGGGHRGPWRMNDSKFLYVDDPTVALDSNGLAYIAWVDQARKNIFFQIYGPNATARFEEPVNVSKTPEIFSWLPRMAVGPDGDEIHVLWQEIVFSGGTHGGEIFFARSGDGGDSFASPVVVPGSADPALGWNGSQQGLLMDKLAVSDTGVVTVVNSSFKRGEASHIWLLRAQTNTGKLER